MMMNLPTHRKRIVDIPLFTGKKFTLFILFFTVVMETLISELGFPTSIRYINDFFIVVLFLMLITKPGRVVPIVGLPLIIAAATILFVFSASAILNGVRPALYLWAMRNTFRGFVFFFACVTYIRKEKLPKIMDALLLLQVVSLFLALYQHFILGLNMDHTGGLFGRGNGAGVNPFNALLFAYYLNSYLAGTQNLRKLVVALLSSLVIAAVAEEKITFVLFAVIVLISLALSRASGKLFVAVLIAIAAGLIGLNILRTLYPDMFGILTSFDEMEKYLNATYESGYVLPRIGSFSIIKGMFFKDDLLKTLFGVGFGNGETSSFSFLIGPYYAAFGFLNYRWFTHQWIFLECGYLGFYCYLAFFVVAALTLLEKRRGASKSQLSLLTCGIALTICVIISIWYNATLKVDMCYLSFFSLAIGFIVTGQNRRDI